MIEEWRAIPGFEGLYDVSNFGRIRSYWIPGWRRIRAEPRLCRIGLQPRARYIQVDLRRDGRSYFPKLHQVVLLAFVGPRPAGHQGAHLNGDSKDNRRANLAYVPIVVNHAHKKSHGTLLSGEQHPRRKLRARDVVEIRRLYKAGGNQYRLAEQFGVCQQTISKITAGVRWKGAST